MRRYGMFYRAGDPLLAVDSEVRIGFRKDERYSSGGKHQEVHKRDLEKALGLSGQRGHTKLDVLGILPSGELALIEVKDEGGDIREAARQLAAHLYTFGMLWRQDGDKLAEAVNSLAAQKIQCGLIPAAGSTPLATRKEMIAVIAAPDGRLNWKRIWEAQVVDAIKHVPDLLFKVRFWLLSSSGDVVEEHQP